MLDAAPHAVRMDAAKDHGHPERPQSVGDAVRPRGCSGDGGDELFAGYDNYERMNNLRRLNILNL